MNTKYLLAASLAGGLISAMLVNAPFVNLINLLLCAGFWIGPIAAVWLYRRLQGTLTFREALATATLAGACHALIGVALSPLGLAGAGGVLNTLQPLVSAQDQPNLEAALTGAGAMLFNLVGIAIDVAFGFLAGLIGGALFRTDRLENKQGVHA